MASPHPFYFGLLAIAIEAADEAINKGQRCLDLPSSPYSAQSQSIDGQITLAGMLRCVRYMRAACSSTSGWTGVAGGARKSASGDTRQLPPILLRRDGALNKLLAFRRLSLACRTCPIVKSGLMALSPIGHILSGNCPCRVLLQSTTTRFRHPRK